MVTLDNWIAADKRVFLQKKDSIDSALLSGSTGIISEISEQNKKDIFYMLCFCLCVPQSKAVKAEEAIDILRTKNFYESSLATAEIVKCLAGRVRFHPTKALRLATARELFYNSSFWGDLVKKQDVYKNITSETALHWFLIDMREWLVATIDGIGFKLASHFMRNIGMRSPYGLAILDVHILNGLERRGLIPDECYMTDNRGNRKIALTKSRYSDIEERMRAYAKQVGISLDELDLLLWSQRTGYVFK